MPPSDNDTNEDGGEVIELIGPRDPGTRRILWDMLKRHPHRKLVIANLRSAGKVLRFAQPPPPPPSGNAS